MASEPAAACLALPAAEATEDTHSTKCELASNGIAELRYSLQQFDCDYEISEPPRHNAAKEAAAAAALFRSSPVSNAGFRARSHKDVDKLRGGNNFVKDAQWSPDGTVILTSRDDATVCLYDAPSLESLVTKEGQSPSKKTQLTPSAQFTEGAPVLDVCFYPGYTVDCPATCCFLTSSQGHPLHLRDKSGELRNTYRPFNNVEEVCHAFSMCFSADGNKIVAGFEQYLRVFDVQRPGRQVRDWLLSTRRGHGQKGIIGAVAACFHNPGRYAAGSYNKSVCIYQEKTRGKAVSWFADTERGYEMGGVTQLRWVGEHVLLSGHRQDSWLRAWDVRMSGDEEGSARALIHRFPRPARTQQRYSFSVAGDVLATGSSDGSVLFYALSTMQPVGSIPSAHGRPCVAAMLHPRSNGAVLLTGSGSRIFPNFDVDSPPRSRSSSPSPMPEGLVSSPKKKRRSAAHDTDETAGKRPQAQVALDNSVRIWTLAWECASGMEARNGGAAEHQTEN